MKKSNRRLVVIGAVTAMATLILFGTMFLFVDQPVQVSELEETIAKLPLGISADAADARLGSAPDRVKKTSGVLMSPVTMLAAENPRAAEYGDSQEYTLRIWTRGDVRAVVAVDTNGLVAGRWAGRR